MMFTESLYPYQQEAVARIAAKRRQALWDEPGLGKTWIAMGSLEAMGLLSKPGARVLILATKTGAALTWGPLLAKQIPAEDWAPTVIEAHSGLLAGRRQRVAAAAASSHGLVVVANHAFIEVKAKDKAHPMWDIEWDAIIIDETQRVLPTKAQKDSEFTNFWRGLSRLKAKREALRLAMSGTPDRGRLENRYGTWMFLLPERYNFTYPYSKWLAETFRLRLTRTPIGRGKFREAYEVIAVKNPKAWEELDQTLAIRRTKGEVAKFLPPKRYIDIELPMPVSTEKSLNAYISEWGKTDDGTRRSASIAYVRFIQFAVCDWTVVDNETGGSKAIPIPASASPKRDWIVEWLTARGFADVGADRNVVIASQFSRVLHWLKRELADAGFVAEVLDGSRSTADRLRVQTQFQGDDPLRIILLNMSLGDSIDLDAADDLIFVDHVNDPDKTQQTEDRVHRVSRDHSVFIWRLVTRDSVDESILAANAQRHVKTRSTYDGSRGVSYLREILTRLAA